LKPLFGDGPGRYLLVRRKDKCGALLYGVAFASCHDLGLTLQGDPKVVVIGYRGIPAPVFRTEDERPENDLYLIEGQWGNFFDRHYDYIVQILLPVVHGKYN